MKKKTKRMSAAEKEWIATFGGDDEEDELQTLTWGQLGKLIAKMSKKHKGQGVTVIESGHETFGQDLQIDKFGNPYIRGF
jgi:hypothetical protein